MGKKKRQDCKSCKSAVTGPASHEAMQWSVRVLEKSERSAYERELGAPPRYFEVVGVDRGRGLWVRDIGSLEDDNENPEAPPSGGGLVFFEDPECSALFGSGDLFTGNWRNGLVTISSALRKSIRSAADASGVRH